MTVTSHWLNNDPTTEIVHIEFIGAWTWDEFWNSIEKELDPLLLSLPGQGGCTIVDLRQGGKLPPDAINQASRMLRGGTKWDMTVIVGNSQFAKMLLSIITRLLPKLINSVAMTNNFDDAARIINDHRAKAAKH